MFSRVTRRTISLLVAVMLFVVPVTGALAADLDKTVQPVATTANETAVVHHLVESGARGSTVPTELTTLPYTATADIKNQVYTNYLFAPSGTTLHVDFTGSVNRDTPGQAKVILYLYNSRTGKQVAYRTMGRSDTFSLSTNITQLRKGDPYYMLVLITDKSAAGVRVKFGLTVSNG